MAAPVCFIDLRKYPCADNVIPRFDPPGFNWTADNCGLKQAVRDKLSCLQNYQVKNLSPDDLLFAAIAKRDLLVGSKENFSGNNTMIVVAIIVAVLAYMYYRKQ